MKKNNIIISFLFGLCSVFYAQEIPPIDTYSPNDYNAESQNWSISQSIDKSIYVANNKGLMQFNGATWQLFPSPNETILRSVHVVDKRIYTGCYMEFGYWERDKFSMLKYTSLSEKIKNIKEDEEFWTISNFRDWVLFQSLDRIYIYKASDDTFEIIESNSKIIKMYQIDGQIYFQKINEGLFRIENGKSILFLGDDLLKNTEVSGLFSINGELLILTNTKGFFKVDNGVLKPWKLASENLLDGKTIYSCIQLNDGSFLLGTISHGLIHLSSDGKLNYHIDQNSGLLNNTVLSTFQDLEGNLWLGLDNGLNCININSPFRIYNDDNGKLGTVYASAISDGILYLGTNQGLFYKSYKSTDDFKFVDGTNGQVWCLVDIDNQLFCGHNSGTFLIEKDKARLISNVQGTWNIKQIPNKPNLLLEGNYNGLNILEKSNGSWRFRNKIKGFDNSSRYFDLMDNNQIFVNHEYKGVFNISVDDNFKEVISVSNDSSINKGLYSSLVSYKDELLYASKEGVYKYNIIAKKFQKDSVLSQMFDSDAYASGKLIYDNKTDKLWGFSDKKITYVTSGALSSEPIFNNISLSKNLRNGMTGFENIILLEDNNYLFGTSTGYIIIDLSKLNEKSYSIAINKVSKSTIEEVFSPVASSEDIVLENVYSTVSFKFSVPEYDKFLEPEYQYQLEGMHDNWSHWTTNSSHIFENLSYGNYKFNVRARIGDRLTSNIASYNFKIKRPWYLSNAMIVLYVLSFLLFSFLMHTFYKNYYKKQREKLLFNTKRELELKELENEQQLMSFKNEKLQQDIENKNRELAISTMSLIKKNQFLGSIKNELIKANEGSSLNSVVKIIDKNLNNTDDWKFFQEAFNNADKDFLKKIKDKHPQLTPNDLRLCAYLRLNLSSKEIAPLLNISTRSVEVKRYRLRKKMSLEREASLTNYILDL